MSLKKPTLMQNQRHTEVTCVFCSYCNFYQLEHFTERNFQQSFKDYWNDLPSTLRLTPERRNQQINALIGNQGYSTDVLKMVLRYRGQQFVEMHNIPQVDFASFVSNLDNGFISILAKYRGLTFRHCICVKNGYLMDSIGSQIYLWRGVIKNYASYEFISAIDCDQATEAQIAKNIVVDLT